MPQTVLLIGSTGMLGSRIAHHLLDQADIRTRLLVRDRQGAAKDKIAPLLAAGAETIDGDLTDPASLLRATEGVDVIVSAVQGGPDIIVEGQVALARAGKANGVRRILPSDFGLDLFKAQPGEHPAFNWRQDADRRIADEGIEQVNMLQGAFADFFGPGSPFVDYDAGTITFWGDGNAPIEMTTVEDTARMTVKVALDRDVTPGKFTFWGDRVSFNDVADIAERATGRVFQRKSLGDEAALRATIAQADAHGAVMLAYSLYMADGQTSMDEQMAGRYPDVALTTFADMLAQRMPASG